MQTNAENQRIQKIRSSILEEKRLISNLTQMIIDAHLKDILTLASNWLGDVETHFLNSKILQEPRTEAALALWLGQAERLLQNAMQQRQFVEDIVQKYGQNARTIPS
jgi:hypothetical protein